MYPHLWGTGLLCTGMGCSRVQGYSYPCDPYPPTWRVSCTCDDHYVRLIIHLHHIPFELLHLCWLSVHCLCIRLAKQVLEDKQHPKCINELALHRSSPRQLSAVMQGYKHLLCHTQDVCCPALESSGPLVRGGG